MANGWQDWLSGAARIAQRTLGTVQAGLLTAAVQREATATEAARQQQAVQAASAYAGLFPEPLVTKPGDTRDTIRVNAVRPIVLATVAFLFGSPPSWDLPDDPAEQAAELAAPVADVPAPDPTDPTAPPAIPDPAAQQAKVAAQRAAQLRKQAEASDTSKPEGWMRECQRQMAWPALLQDMGINGAVYGTPAWRIREADDEHEYPYLQVLAPECLRVHTDPRDIARVLGYTYQMTGTDPETGLPQVWRQRVERGDPESADAVGTIRGTHWVIIDEVAGLDGSNGWVDTGNWDVIEQSIWPYAWCPILHCKNLPNPNAIYGLSDISETVIEANLALNRSLTTSARIDRHHAGPRVWLRKMAGKKIDTRAGAIADLGEDGEIGQLVPAVDGTAGGELRRELKEAICEESATPSIVLGHVDQAGDPSGVALRVKLWPLLHKTELKRNQYGPLIIETMRRLWELGGFGSKVITALTWPEQLPTDPLEERQVLLVDQQLGIASKATIADKLDYNWQQEQDNLADEKAAAPPPLLPGLTGPATGAPAVGAPLLDKLISKADMLKPPK